MSDSIARDMNAHATDASGNVLPTVAPPATPPLPPDPVAPLVPPPGYEILYEIGQGGMGVVYHARDCALNRPVALKFLQKRYANDPAAAARFHYEAQITGQLQHPGIPPVHQVGTLPDGQPFLAMKLIQGRTLDELLSEQGPGAGRWLGVFEAICQAVGYAHSQNVIHRDLKPGNVMVGAFGEVQVMDWGLAKVLTSTPVAVNEADPDATQPPQPAQTAPELTRAGSVLGTPAFMPPEQAIGAINRLNRRSDVFGLGGILCVLLTGKPPFVAADAESTRQLAARAKLDDVFARLDGCGAEPELIALAKQCLSAEQEVRPADGGVLAGAVAQLRQEAEDRARKAELDRARIQVQADEQRKRRRLMMVASGMVIAVLLAGVVGTMMGLLGADRARREEARQKEQAEEARDLARQRYQLALDTFNQMVFAIQKKLETRSGTQDLRKDLLENARRGLRTLLREAERQGNPDSTLVWSHLRMGDVELILGHTQAARQEYETGHGLAQSLAQAGPRNAQAQRDLNASFNKLGNVALQMGKTKEALTYYRKGLEVCQFLAQADPTNAEAQRDLSISFNLLGDVMVQLSKTKEALEFYEKDLEISQRLAQADPKNVQAQRDLSFSFEKLGNVMVQLGKTQEALEFYQKRLGVHQRLAQSDPRNAQAQRDLFISFNKLGDVMLQLGKTKEGLEFYEKHLEISQRLAQADPKNVQAQRDLSVSFIKLGNVMLQLGKTKEALEFYEKDLEISQRLAQADPRNAQAQRDLFVSFEKLGDVMLQLGKTKEALEFYKKDLEISQRLAQADPKSAQAQRDLSVSFEKLGNVMVQLGKTQEALAFYQKRLEVHQRLAQAASPKNAQAQRDLSISFFKLGNVMLQLGKTKEALEFYEKDLEISQRLAQADPRNAQAQRDLSCSFEKLGDVLLQLNKTKEALEFYQKVLEVRQRLAQADPKNAQAQMDLFISYQKLGSAEKAQQDYDKAGAWFARGRAVLLPWHQKNLLVGQTKNYLALVDSEIAFCKDAEKATGSLDFVFEHKPEQIAALLDIRVRALLTQNKLADTSATAQRWAEWAEKQQKDRDDQCYKAACALALCAAASEAKQKDVLVARAVAMLTGLRERGYFKVAARVAHFKGDKDFAGVREQPGFRAFARTLEGE
jgi:tetratricopeptide (TPR) repeat protein